MKGGDYEIFNKTHRSDTSALDPVRLRQVRGDGQPGPAGQDRSDDQRSKEVRDDAESGRADHVLPGRGTGGSSSLGTVATAQLSKAHPVENQVEKSVGKSVENSGFPLNSPPSFPPVENNENPPVVPTGGESLEVEETTDTYSESEIQWETVGIDSIKASKNTWCFRLRWTNPDGSRPQVKLMNVSDHVYRSITRNRRNYAAFKKQLIAGYQSAVRADQESV